jgi:hypothetical protein
VVVLSFISISKLELKMKREKILMAEIKTSRGNEMTALFLRGNIFRERYSNLKKSKRVFNRLQFGLLKDIDFSHLSTLTISGCFSTKNNANGFLFYKAGSLWKNCNSKQQQFL